jgi:glycosyltransferase involved in cell wall biosynthesis
MIQKSIIIPTHNDEECVFACVNGIIRNTDNYEIIFVLDDSVEFKEILKDYGRVIETSEPFVFSHRVNLGLKAAEGEYLFILNDDTVPQPLWAEKMISSDQMYGPGLVGARCRHGECHNPDAYFNSCEVKFTNHTVNMFAVMISRRVFNVVGLLDERFVTYGGDDDDYTLRVRRHKFRTIISECGSANLVGRVLHRKSRAFGMDRIMKELPETRQIFRNKWGVSMPVMLDEDWEDDVRRPFTLPLVSVLMPTRGHHEYIKKAVESVLYQSYENFELLIGVDGEDQKETRDILSQIKDPRVRVFCWAEQMGSCHVRNALYIRSKGEFIALMDSDDRMMSDRLKTQLEAMTPETDIVHSAFHIEGPDGEWKDTEVFPFNKAMLLSFKTCLAGGTFFMRRYVMKNMFNEKYARAFDFEFALRTYGKFRYKFIPKPLLIYNRHAGSHLSGSGQSMQVHKELKKIYQEAEPCE